MSEIFLKAIDEWIESDKNIHQLSILTENKFEVVIQVPSEDFESTQVNSLTIPLTNIVVGIDSDCDSLAELVNESYTYLANKKMGPSEVLQFVSDWIDTNQEGWGDVDCFNDNDVIDDDGGWGEDIVEDDTIIKNDTEMNASTDLDMTHWSCPKCDYSNEQSVMKCKECNYALPETTTFLKRTTSYKVSDKDELLDNQRRMIDDISYEKGITNSAAAIILSEMKWNVEEIKKLNTKEFKDLLIKTGTINTIHTVFSTNQGKPNEIIECMVCCDDIPFENSLALVCEHRMCRDCWKGFLEEEINGGSVSGGTCLHTTCPYPDCNNRVGEEVFELLCSNDMYEKYKFFQFQSLINNSDDYTWCPAAGCEFVVGGSARKKTVSCKCFHSFCFTCKGDAHAPATCEDFKTWQSKNQGSATLDMKYIMSNCKACPKCGTFTQKNGGCMFVACTQCTTGWCWHCGKTDHHVWECAKPVYSLVDTARDEKRYLHYFARYFNHFEAVRIIDERRKQVQKQMDHIVNESSKVWSDVEFLSQAVELVVHCRKVLCWSYVRSFFIETDQKRSLLEFHQSQLEQFTEKLNALIEGPNIMEEKLLALQYSSSLQKYIMNVEFGEFGE